MHITRDTSKGQIAAFAFGQVDVAASQSDVQLPTAQLTANVDGYGMPWDGEIVGIGWALTTAATAGVGTIGASIDGTEDADTTLTIPADSATTTGYQRVLRGKAAFSAGARLGVEITTDGSWLPTTADLSVIVYVLFALDGI